MKIFGYSERVHQRRPQRLLSTRSSCKSDQGCGKVVASNFPGGVNQADVFQLREVSDAFGVEHLAI